MPDTPAATPRPRWLLPAAAALAIVLLLPFAATRIPPLLDFPDHVAEMFVIAQAPHDPVLAGMYSIHWTVVANSAVEAVMPPLLSVLPLWPTGAAFAALSLLLPVVGGVAFSRAAFGRWSAWPLAGGLVAYNTLFLLGFMNFLIATGTALLAAAGWMAFRRRWPLPALLFGVAVAPVLFFMHLFGLLLFGMLIGVHEMAALVGPPGRRWPGLAPVLGRLLPLLLIVVAPAWLLAGSTLAGTAGATLRLPWRIKAAELFFPFLTYFQGPERLLALVVVLGMAALLLLRRARVAPEAACVCLLLLLVWPFVPHVYKDTGYIDARLPTMMGFLMFAGFEPTRLPRRVAQVLAAVVAAVIVVRTAAVGAVWQGHNADLKELGRVIAHVEPGSQVLAVDVPNAELYPYWRSHRRNWVTAAYIKTYYHYAALLVTERRAFWPRLFTGLGKQPVVVNPAFAAWTAPEGELPDYHVLLSPVPPPQAAAEAPYLRDWRTKFDYVLLLAAGAAADAGQLPSGTLLPVERTEFASLFRVRRPAMEPPLPR